MTNADLFRAWFIREELEVDDDLVPDERGLFRRGSLVCVLPILRAFYRGDRPDWRPETWVEWRPEGQGEDARAARRPGLHTRFLRADHALRWIAATVPDGSFVARLRQLLDRCWLVPIEEYTADRPGLVHRRVETIYARKSDRSGLIEWTRQVRPFPDAIRREVEGLDPVHTPESSRAGLTRHLAVGWRVTGRGTNEGKLRRRPDALVWGPSTAAIPHQLNDVPRRLMLGASLQSHAVPLLEGGRPRVASDWPGWVPPGRQLRVKFTTDGGLTHEDAVVLSGSAAEKLTCDVPVLIVVPVPAQVAAIRFRSWRPPTPLRRLYRRGQRLATAALDLFALGYDADEAAALGARCGFLKVDLPGAVLPFDAELIGSRYEPASPRDFGRETSPRRGTLYFHLRKRSAVGVGDKVATRHGVKGIVVEVRDDDEMPVIGDGGHRAEILLSPVGTLRRGALGQFREADEAAFANALELAAVDRAGREPDGSDEAARAAERAFVEAMLGGLPRHGSIFVMRQPQDASPRCRVRGRDVQGDPSIATPRGQRYGEMEFWALMAYGADAIARELLSQRRSTATWPALEATLDGPGPRPAGVNLPRRALNRFLATLGVSVEGGRLLLPPRDGTVAVVGLEKSSGEFDVNSEPHRLKLIAHLDDPDWFLDHGGEAVLRLPRPVELSWTVKRPEVAYRISSIPIALPEGGPPGDGGPPGPRTDALRALLKCLIEGSGPSPEDRRRTRLRLARLVWNCVRPRVEAALTPSPGQGLELILTPSAEVETRDAPWEEGADGGQPVGEPSQWKALLADLDKPDWSHELGPAAIRLESPLRLVIGRRRREPVVRLHSLRIVPPWLRPSVGPRPHRLTEAYRRLLRDFALGSARGTGRGPQRSEAKAGDEAPTGEAEADAKAKVPTLESLVWRCVSLALDGGRQEQDRCGAGVFLRREILGRRLTRSARAVIVPDLTLSIDQVRIPARVARILFDGLDEDSRSVVLVNRNPTLQRRNLLAMRPVVDEDDRLVFGLPPGVLKVFGADFDGDQACVVALEDRNSIEQSRTMLPGSRPDLRVDPFRPGRPAFPLLKELASPKDEAEHARDLESSQEAWCRGHSAVLRRALEALAKGDGWDSPAAVEKLHEFHDFLAGPDQAAWLARARKDMRIIYESVRKKSALGGVLRREVYRRPTSGPEGFRKAIEATQAVTEPLAQSALSSKGGAGATALRAAASFFRKPSLRRKAALAAIDATIDPAAAAAALGPPCRPDGLLAWMARPELKTLFRLLASDPAPAAGGPDPRIEWFLGDDRRPVEHRSPPA